MYNYYGCLELSPYIEMAQIFVIITNNDTKGEQLSLPAAR